ncbi:hypothetical protein P886_3764 [Alteromonadaceae bacterium 2753L.S.0a.02]|nr:hypothetical protein P886_3764 [Alteromonadaceae bacterium 2753L.S.0a.02]
MFGSRGAEGKGNLPSVDELMYATRQRIEQLDDGEVRALSAFLDFMELQKQLGQSGVVMRISHEVVSDA